ncbi:hypothetical protein M5X00_14780 [Paenibacillus alvei]|uniref:hypothetical protein n=1 Tax=Paenibacillus alvei TaxID=44250 RepID=UPI001431419C|nr:hypothetical protein [Paenibacillus alvei]MCY9543373.1 hypothetical protein [Paenibacillus alvei]MCY9704747.1 hypothetical protein [Paenibacillus alvei]MCY9733700.1 hypothetical protein [Paenibacillus alvei]MCY9755509.1 hypothetical protein [Paenibacillus alvei]MEC0082060.1 hypothetical protein [Paenibacillus alvei]
MARKRNTILLFAEKQDKREQPEGCKGCEWGRWDGVAQFCLRPIPCPRKDGVRK